MLLPSRCDDFRRAQRDLCIWHPPLFFFWAKNRLIRHTRRTFSELASADSPRQRDLLKIPGEKCAHGAATAAQKATAAQHLLFRHQALLNLTKISQNARVGAPRHWRSLYLSLYLYLYLLL